MRFFAVNVIGLSRVFIQAPLTSEWFGLFPGSAEFQAANLLRNGGALMLGLQSRHELGRKSASFLGIQVADFFGHINQRVDVLVMALFGAFFGGAAVAANFHRKLFA